MLCFNPLCEFKGEPITLLSSHVDLGTSAQHAGVQTLDISLALNKNLVALMPVTFVLEHKEILTKEREMTLWKPELGNRKKQSPLCSYWINQSWSLFNACEYAGIQKPYIILSKC